MASISNFHCFKLIQLVSLLNKLHEFHALFFMLSLVVDRNEALLGELPHADFRCGSAGKCEFGLTDEVVSDIDALELTVVG